MKVKLILTTIIVALTLESHAQTYYIQIINKDGNTVKGNSLNATYNGNAGWSEINNFSHSTSNETSLNLQNQGIPQSGVIQITKIYYPNTSNHLSSVVHNGQHNRKVIIVGVVPNGCGGGFIEFVKYTFANVFVGNFNKKVENSGSAFALIDNISLRASAMHVKHITNNPNCTTTETSTGWNFKNNTSWNGMGDPPF